tara:strand:+ start:288 stop:602 length:315 start_codon:yes stop_codon:yes gene_type:complete
MTDNKIIAEFMGVEKENGLYLFTTPMDDYKTDTLYFDTSWDWLMPVVEKIETLGYTFEKNYQRIDNDWQSLIVKGNDILYQEFNENSLKSSYYVLVELIKRLNK